MKDRLAKEKAHPPVEDCLACHRPHASREVKLAAQPVSELCGQCHDDKAPSFGAAHLGIDARSVNCVSCHDPHASKDPKLFKATVHPPFAARQCDACHLADKKK
jgi:predicted CXXCH cytochrome family protein